ncbi:hypothetical protein [Mucilaginibacter sp.]
MKKLLVLILCWLCYHVALAQPPAKGRTLYYLMDTASTPQPDRMWAFSEDLPLQYYVLAYPCLDDGDKPHLGIDTRKPAGIITAKQLHELQLLSLPQLIKSLKV